MNEMSELRIRQAGADDSGVITHFIRAMLHDMASVGGHDVNPCDTFWSGFRVEVSEAIKKDDHLYLLARTSSGVVGFLEGKTVKLPDAFAQKKSFHIRSVYVVPDRRRQGIATLLIEQALRWAVERECREADLNVLILNNAKSVYENLGFKIFQHEMRLKLSTTE